MSEVKRHRKKVYWERGGVKVSAPKPSGTYRNRRRRR